MILLEQFREYWTKRQYHLSPGTFLLAVSGGGDSMVMAHLFLKSGISFGVAHCNFGLRGVESDLDEQLVHDWCKANGVPFHSTRFDTKVKSAEWKKGTQETARILRYEWFEQIRAGNHYAKIATAHHADDNVETMLINLFKGTGISGLHGILPENGHIIRPLLFAGKDVIAAYAAANDVPYRDDASNATDDYLRNAVRHNIVPVVKEWFPNATTHVNETIGRLGEVEQLYKKAIAQERKKLIEQRGADHYIPVRKLLPREPLATIVYELLIPFGFTSAQLPHVLSLLHSDTGHFVCSATHKVIRNREFLIITAIPPDTADLIVIEGVPCTIETGRHSYTISMQAAPKSIPADPNEAYLDMKNIEFPIFLRKWKMGDYFYPFGMKMKKKKVSRLLIDQKVPLHEKENIRILECNKRIAWVSGIRPDERFRVDAGTERVLVIKRQLI